MLKAIFYKEWIKTRWYFLLALALSLSLSTYCVVRLSRAMEVQGGAKHFWEMMIQRDVVFIDLLQYMPLLIGTVWALVQFVPEMHHKCLKLTLHLPYSQLKMTMAMLLSGFVLLTICFTTNFILLGIYFSNHFAFELVRNVLVTALPWYLAGLTAYLLVSWLCLEPTWKRRVVNGLLSLFFLRIFFLSNTPQAYTAFIPYLVVAFFLLFPLTWHSIIRFKEGKQD